MRHAAINLSDLIFTVHFVHKYRQTDKHRCKILSRACIFLRFVLSTQSICVVSGHTNELLLELPACKSTATALANPVIACSPDLEGDAQNTADYIGSLN